MGQDASKRKRIIYDIYTNIIYYQVAPWASR